jgi:fumarate reductase subunit D
MSVPDPGRKTAEPVLWLYPFVGGFIAEALTIAFIALVVALTGHGGPGPNGEPFDPVAQRIGAVSGATLGSMLCFILAWWAARRAGHRFELHGLLTGVSASILTGLGVAFGARGQAAFYVLAVVVKLFAGRAGGSMAGRMAERAGDPEA